MARLAPITKPFVSESLSHNAHIIVNNDNANISTLPSVTMSAFVVSIALILSHLLREHLSLSRSSFCWVSRALPLVSPRFALGSYHEATTVILNEETCTSRHLLRCCLFRHM